MKATFFLPVPRVIASFISQMLFYLEHPKLCIIKINADSFCTLFFIQLTNFHKVTIKIKDK